MYTLIIGGEEKVVGTARKAAGLMHLCEIAFARYGVGCHNRIMTFAEVFARAEREPR